MSDYIDLSIRQFIEAWRLMCGGGPNTAFAGGDGIQYVFSGCPIPFFNVAVPVDRKISHDVLKSRAEHACAWASGQRVPWLFVVTHEALDPGTDAASVLDGCGLAPLMPLTGMLAQQVAPVAALPNELDLATAQDDAECSAILDVNARAYRMDLEAGKDMMGKRSFWTNHFPILGRTGGNPACCAAVLMVDGYRYVALVATDPAHQRRGYADAAMRRALEQAAAVHGQQPTVLHATEAGRSIYARMGYATISTHTIFIEKSFLPAH